METVKFLNYECSVEVKSYGTGRTALQLVSAIDDFEEGLFIGNPIALATVNVPEMDLGSDSVFIKNYSEKFPDFNLKVSTLEINRGIAGGRNEAINRATGDFIAFLDADDFQSRVLHGNVKIDKIDN